MAYGLHVFSASIEKWIVLTSSFDGTRFDTIRPIGDSVSGNSVEHLGKEVVLLSWPFINGAQSTSPVAERVQGTFKTKPLHWRVIGLGGSEHEMPSQVVADAVHQ